MTGFLRGPNQLQRARHPADTERCGQARDGRAPHKAAPDTFESQEGGLLGALGGGGAHVRWPRPLSAAGRWALGAVLLLTPPATTWRATPRGGAPCHQVAQAVERGPRPTLGLSAPRHPGGGLSMPADRSAWAALRSAAVQPQRREQRPPLWGPRRARVSDAIVWPKRKAAVEECRRRRVYRRYAANGREAGRWCPPLPPGPW